MSPRKKRKVQEEQEKDSQDILTNKRIDMLFQVFEKALNNTLSILNDLETRVMGIEEKYLDLDTKVAYLEENSTTIGSSSSVDQVTEKEKIDGETSKFPTPPTPSSSNDVSKFPELPDPKKLGVLGAELHKTRSQQRKKHTSATATKLPETSESTLSSKSIQIQLRDELKEAFKKIRDSKTE